MFLFGNALVAVPALIFRSYMDTVEQNCHYYLHASRGQSSLPALVRPGFQLDLVKQWNCALIGIHNAIHNL
eukprot:g11657.t1